MLRLSAVAGKHRAHLIERLLGYREPGQKAPACPRQMDMTTPDHILATAIISDAVQRHGLTVDALMVRSRTGRLDRRAPISLARAVAMWRIRHQMAWSYPRIARRFGVSHTSVIHAVRRIARDPRYGARNLPMKTRGAKA